MGMVLPVEVCAIVKNEGRYLDEWFEFHLLQGVTRFHIFENNSTDDTMAVLQRWEHVANIVDFDEWYGQNRVYESFIRVYPKQAWVAFIDADEFLYSPTGKPLQ